MAALRDLMCMLHSFWSLFSSHFICSYHCHLPLLPDSVTTCLSGIVAGSICCHSLLWMPRCAVWECLVHL